MKKQILFLSAVAILTIGTSAFAEDISAGGTLTVPTGSPQAGSTITKLSNNVVGSIVASTNQFSAVTKHLNGTKNYATSSTDTKLYWTDVSTANKGQATLEITLSNSDTTDFNAWTAL